MKKNKGFTLIELLAIIVILALIAVIISPIILGIIEDSKLSAATDSAYGYKEAVGKYYASQLSQNSDFLLNGEYTIGTDGSISDEENNYPILVTGTIPRGGSVTIEKGTVTAGCIQMDEYAVTIEDKKVTSTVKGTCENMPTTPVEVVVEEFPTVTDENPGIICGNGTTEDYDNSDTCYIYSVEDLVAFSNMVNSGKNFQGKTVQLMNGLDLKEDKSYADVNSNLFGDVNENNTTSATLKEELTDETAKGFKPIGNNTNTFAGIFEGNTHTIKNLLIKRSGISYLGLFGYNTGTIKGIKVINANITGYEHLGVIVGHNNGSVTSVIADGNIGGSNCIGVAVGSQNNSSAKVEAITSGNLNSTTNNYALTGGILGRNDNGTVNGIYKSGQITSSTSSNAYRTIGYIASGTTTTTGALKTITVRGNTKTSTSLTAADGRDITANGINNIAITDTILDTYIGGDNNNDGYYYDYDTNGEITIYKLSDRPLNITMSGEGTEQKPYIINNYNELKQVSYNLGSAGTGKYYKLNADIDLTNKNPLMLSSEAYPFTGVFDGNTHTISNITLIGHSYIGLFGYNTGTIRGLKVTNVNINGYEHLGVIVGHNDGRVTSVIANGNISGSNCIGVAVGSQNNSSAKVEAITSGNLNSTTNNYALTGGILGSNDNGTVNGIYKSGQITSSTSSNAYRTIGYIASGTTTTTGALKTITVRGNTKTSTSLTAADGRDIPANGINNIAITEAILDTYIGGDNNNDGYYYDYDTNGEITIYKLSDRPLNITMSGEGTEQKPYIINNYNELKQVSYNLGSAGTGKYYKLNADIDLTNKNPLMLSSEAYPFTGVFDGNTHTISNITLIGHSYIGLFGYNQGTIKGLKVINANITGYEHLGVIAGKNDGSITIAIADGNVSGSSRIGVAVGSQNNSSAKVEAITSGNLNSTTNNYALIGGILGRNDNGTANGIYRSGTITASTGSNAYRTVGYKATGTTTTTGALSTITVRGNTKTSSDTSSYDGKSYTAAELQTLTPYIEVGLNTSSTSGEYRYELDSNYNPYIVKNTNN